MLGKEHFKMTYEKNQCQLKTAKQKQYFYAPREIGILFYFLLLLSGPILVFTMLEIASEILHFFSYGSL